MIKFFINIFILILFLPSILLAKSEYFQEGINLFNNKKFKDAKFKFEQEIVINPKSEQSYLYLSKIFNKLDKNVLYTVLGQTLHRFSEKQGARNKDWAMPIQQQTKPHDTT